MGTAIFFLINEVQQNWFLEKCPYTNIIIGRLFVFVSLIIESSLREVKLSNREIFNVDLFWWSCSTEKIDHMKFVKANNYRNNENKIN